MFKLKNQTIFVGCLLGLSQVSHAAELFSLDAALSGWDFPYSINSSPASATNSTLTVTNQQVSLNLNGNTFLVNPAANSYMAAINTAGANTEITESGGSFNVDSALGLPAATFFNSLNISGDSDSNPTNVALISKNVALNAATPYSFYWAYAAQDYVPYKDGVFFSYSKNGSGTLVILARNGNVTAPTISPGTTGYPAGTVILPSYGSTSWNKFSFSVPSAGTYKVSFGAFNAGDTAVDPILFLADQNGNIIGDVFLTGPSAEDTHASMLGNADSLRRIFSLQASYTNPGLSYDCTTFDSKGICIGFSGRYSSTTGSSPEATSGILTAAFKITPNIRIGAFIEEYATDITRGGVRVDSANPDFGVFGVWSQTENGEGFKVRAAYRYGNRSIEITRDAIGTAEAGSGTSNLTTQGAQVTVSKGYRINNTLLASPYVGVRYTDIKRNGYTESTTDAVTTPLTYDLVRQESTSVLLGVNLATKYGSSLSVTGSVGLESDTSQKISSYSASGVSDLAAVDFKGDTRRTRAVASAGVAYMIGKTQQVSAQVFYREEAFNAIATTTGMLSYTAGF